MRIKITSNCCCRSPPLCTSHPPFSPHVLFPKCSWNNYPKESYTPPVPPSCENLAWWVKFSLFQFFFSFFSARREKKTQETSSDRTKYEKSRKIAFRSETKTKKISYAIRKSFFLCLKIPAHFRREVRKLFQRFSCVKIVEMKNP